jgi:hypothetical protein
VAGRTALHYAAEGGESAPHARVEVRAAPGAAPLGGGAGGFLRGGAAAPAAHLAAVARLLDAGALQRRDRAGVAPRDLVRREDLAAVLAGALRERQLAACAAPACGARAPAVLCPRCRLAAYCCQAHAAGDWARHRVACAEPAAPDTSAADAAAHPAVRRALHAARVRTDFVRARKADAGVAAQRARACARAQRRAVHAWRHSAWRARARLALDAWVRRGGAAAAAAAARGAGGGAGEAPGDGAGGEDWPACSLPAARAGAGQSPRRGARGALLARASSVRALLSTRRRRVPGAEASHPAGCPDPIPDDPRSSEGFCEQRPAPRALPLTPEEVLARRPPGEILSPRGLARARAALPAGRALFATVPTAISPLSHLRRRAGAGAGPSAELQIVRPERAIEAARQRLMDATLADLEPFAREFVLHRLELERLAEQGAPPEDRGKELAALAALPREEQEARLDALGAEDLRALATALVPAYDFARRRELRPKPRAQLMGLLARERRASVAGSDAGAVAPLLESAAASRRASLVPAREGRGEQAGGEAGAEGAEGAQGERAPS